MTPLVTKRWWPAQDAKPRSFSWLPGYLQRFCAVPSQKTVRFSFVCLQAQKVSRLGFVRPSISIAVKFPFALLCGSRPQKGCDFTPTTDAPPVVLYLFSISTGRRALFASKFSGLLMAVNLLRTEQKNRRSAVADSIAIQRQIIYQFFP